MQHHLFEYPTGPPDDAVAEHAFSGTPLSSGIVIRYILSKDTILRVRVREGDLRNDVKDAYMKVTHSHTEWGELHRRVRVVKWGQSKMEGKVVEGIPREGGRVMGHPKCMQLEA